MITRQMIHKLDCDKQRIRKDTYKKIYEQSSRQVQFAVSANQRQVHIQIPEFLLGYPAYNTERACMYIKRQFTLAGFDITDTTYTSFFVSWYPQAVAKRQVERVEEDVPFPEPEGLPSLINLKKAANRYRAG